jgi:glutamate racemase
MQPHNPKHILIACNTATALALPALRNEFLNVSISGVIDPGAKAAAAAAGNKQYPVIAVIATEATIRSRAYEHALARRRQHARVCSIATPLLAPIVEEGRSEDDPLVRLALEQYLRPVLKRGIDVLLLGCTHYPLIKRAIQSITGPKVQVIDSADQCAEDVARRLLTVGMLRGDSGKTGSLRCFVTDESPRFSRLASRFLGFTVATPTWVAPETLYRQETDITVMSA